MKSFNVELVGSTPLLHHRMTPEQIFGLLNPKSKKVKVQAEPRTPREVAEQHAYKTQDGKYYIPLDYVVGAFKHVAADYRQTSSSKKSYKSIVGGIFRPVKEFAILQDLEGRDITNFEVDLRKGVNHLRGAVAICRPRFDRWKVSFDIMIDDSLINQEMVLEILEDAGRRAGIGSFRVAKGGIFGQFSVTSFQQLKE